MPRSWKSSEQLTATELAWFMLPVAKEQMMASTAKVTASHFQFLPRPFSM